MENTKQEVEEALEPTNEESSMQDRKTADLSGSEEPKSDQGECNPVPSADVLPLESDCELAMSEAVADTVEVMTVASDSCLFFLGIEVFASELKKALSSNFTEAANGSAFHDFLDRVEDICKDHRDEPPPCQIDERDPSEAVRSTFEQPFAEFLAKSQGPPETVSATVAKLTDGLRETESDVKEFMNLYLVFREWEIKCQGLRDQLGKVESDIQEIVQPAQQVPEIAGLSDEDLELWKNRIDGLNLIARMVARLSQKIDNMAIPVAPSQDSLRNTENIVESIRSTLEETRRHNYRQVSRLRDCTRQIRESFFSFLKNYFFGIIDALEDSKKNCEEWRNKLVSEHTDSSANVTEWFTVYDRAIATLENLLGQYSVCPLLAEKGEKINYDEQEVFDAEEVPDLDDESVAEMIRKGYVYKAPDEGHLSVIRPTQIVAVRNVRR